jgi:hypothetical protein
VIRYHKHKFHAQPTKYNGIRYDSKKEARYAQGLELRKKAGEIIFYLRQIPFHLPGGVVCRIDFQEFHTDGTVHFVEVKGYETKEWVLKKRLVESLYPIKIEVV